MKNENENLRKENELQGTDGFQPGRRKALTVGALLVPTIVTLHATPAWAQTDYTITAYRYGTHAGLCRNPKFKPDANPNSPRSQQFIECPDQIPPGHGRDIHWDSEFEGQEGSDTTDLNSW